MNKIITVDKAVKISEKTRLEGKTVVLVGGCFDILHKGHITFLQEAKNKGDFLFVMLESDESVKKIKGEERPIHSQKKRALVLSTISSVDCVILLPTLKTNSEYDFLVKSIKPDIIGITRGDTNKKHKDRQAKEIGAKVIEVLEEIPNTSTTNLIKLLT